MPHRARTTRPSGPGRPPRRLTIRAVALVGVAAAALVGTIAPSGASPAEPVPPSQDAVLTTGTTEVTGTDETQAADAECRVSARLVPRCGAFFGVAPNPIGSESFDQALVNFERTVGRTSDISRYYTRGQSTLFPTAIMKHRADEAGRERLLSINWRPTITWRQVASGGADAYLVRLANHIRTTYDRPFYLSLHAEMEAEVNESPASGMTAADFRAFYRHTVDVLRKNGADQVVFVVNYMGAPHWGDKPWFEDLYPGRKYVDWIAYDPFAFGKPPVWRTDFAGMVDRKQGGTFPGFYTWATTNYPKKPLMLAEWGVDEATDDTAYKPGFFSKTISQLADYPRIKALIYWDHPDAPVVGVTNVRSTSRTLQEFKKFALHPDVVRAGEAYLDRPARP